MNQDTNPAPVPGTEASAAAPVSNANAVAVGIKEIVKQATGRDYTSDEAAIEGIKNTYAAVTSRHQPEPEAPKPPVDEVQLLRQELKTSNWYQDHPEYREYKGLISRFGIDPEQVVRDPEFIKAYQAIKTASENQNKSVLTSNPRIAVPKNDDYSADLDRVRIPDGQPGHMDVAEFMAKHKGFPTPTE